VLEFHTKRLTQAFLSRKKYRCPSDEFWQFRQILPSLRITGILKKVGPHKINKFRLNSVWLRATLVFASLASVELMARPGVNDSSRAAGQNCSGCHGTDDYGNFLSQSFTDGENLVANQVYRVSVSIPGGVARSGINIDIPSYNNGVGGAFVGTFVTDINGTTPVTSTGTFRVGTGNAARTETTSGATYDFFWKAPSTIPDGVKIRVQLVEGNNSGSSADEGADSAELILGDTTSTTDPGTDPNNPPPQDSAPDTEGASSSGGAFGGGFGCARLKMLGDHSTEFPLDLGFGFLLLIGLIATYRSRDEDA